MDKVKKANLTPIEEVTEWNWGCKKLEEETIKGSIIAIHRSALIQLQEEYNTKELKFPDYVKSFLISIF